MDLYSPSDLSLSNLIKDPKKVDGHYNSSEIKGLSYHFKIDLVLFIPLMNFSLNLIRKYLQHFREQTSRCLEFSIKLVPYSYTSLRWKKRKSFLYQQNEINYLNSLIDQATPGFELGKKDLQSPALPLGHIAKIIQKNRSEYPSSSQKNKNGFLKFFF